MKHCHGPSNRRASQMLIFYCFFDYIFDFLSILLLFFLHAIETIFVTAEHIFHLLATGMKLVQETPPQTIKSLFNSSNMEIW